MPTAGYFTELMLIQLGLSVFVSSPLVSITSGCGSFHDPRHGSCHGGSPEADAELGLRRFAALEHVVLLLLVASFRMLPSRVPTDGRMVLFGFGHVRHELASD